MPPTPKKENININNYNWKTKSLLSGNLDNRLISIDQIDYSANPIEIKNFHNNSSQKKFVEENYSNQSFNIEKINFRNN